MIHLLVLHGPNLNLLGGREPEVYGSETLDQINDKIRRWSSSHDVEIQILQSNHEGELIDTLHIQSQWADGIVLNPGGLAHTSVCLHDAVKAVGIPTVEVHVSNIFSRESFRRESIVSRSCVGIIAGFGGEGYIAACEQLKTLLLRTK